MIIYILLGLILLGIGYVGFFKKEESPLIDTSVQEENARLKSELSQKDIIVGELSSEVEKEKTEKDRLSGQNKQLFVELTGLKADKTALQREKDNLTQEVSDFKASENRRIKEQEENLQKLEAARNALEDERQRIRREDEQRLEEEKERIHRMWAEHEGEVKVRLIDLCKAPQYGFQYYDNNNLPINFGGRFKPDFLVEFLGQYVIFDAKVSESDLQGYINNNVKTTVEKIGGNPQIYNSVFFVVPTIAMQSLKRIRFYEQGYEFFVISPESIEVVLAAFKKISSYELAQQLDPRDRENIVNIIAEFDNHINLRNALDALGAQSGISILKKTNNLSVDLKEEIELKKHKIPLRLFTPTDVRTLMMSTENQQEAVDDLMAPKPLISKNHIKTVKPILKGRKS